MDKLLSEHQRQRLLNRVTEEKPKEITEDKPSGLFDVDLSRTRFIRSRDAWEG